MNFSSDINSAGSFSNYKQIECGLFVPAEIADVQRHVDFSLIGRYERVLKNKGRSLATIQKYIHDIQSFVAYLGERPLSIGYVREWLEGQKQMRHINTVNNAISALNGFFRWLGRTDCQCEFYRSQEPQYREDNRDLSISEFQRLLDVADQRMKAIALTIKGTGIRVSELQFFTVEAVKSSVVSVDNKGKVRKVFLDPSTKQIILNYCERNNIQSGVVFRNTLGNALSRSFIWRSLKKFALKAGIMLSKVFPHNLRHLFAVERYKIDHDIEALRLDMGHTLVSTTQKYLKETMNTHFNKLLKRAEDIKIATA